MSRYGHFRSPIVIAMIVALFNSTALTPLLSFYTDAGFSEAAITGAFALYGVVVLLVLLFGSPLLDKVGRRSALLVGLAISAAGTVVTLLTTEAWEVFLSRAISGVSAGIFVGTANAFLLTETPPGKPAGTMPAIATAAGLGVGPVLGGALSNVLPNPQVSVWIFNLAILAVSAGLLFLVDNPMPPAQAGAAGPSVAPAKRPMFEKVGSVGFGGFLAFGIYSAAAPSLLHSVFSIDARWLVGIIAGAFFLASIVGPLISQVLSPRKAIDVGATAIVAGLIGVGASIYLGSLRGFLVAGVLTGIGQGIAMDSGLGMLTQGLTAGQSASMTLAYFVVLYIAVSVPVVIIGVLSSAMPLPTLTAICCVGAGILIAIVSMIASARQARAAPVPQTG